MVTLATFHDCVLHVNAKLPVDCSGSENVVLRQYNGEHLVQRHVNECYSPSVFPNQELLKHVDLANKFTTLILAKFAPVLSRALTWLPWKS